jgi:hypothetical protein
MHRHLYPFFLYRAVSVIPRRTLKSVSSRVPRRACLLTAFRSFCSMVSLIFLWFSAAWSFLESLGAHLINAEDLTFYGDFVTHVFRNMWVYLSCQQSSLSDSSYDSASFSRGATPSLKLSREVRDMFVFLLSKNTHRGAISFKFTWYCPHRAPASWLPSLKDTSPN